MKRRLFTAVAALVGAAAVPPAAADVIVMQDGKRQYGLIVRNHPDEAKVTISTVSGDIAIPRARIASIEVEPPAVSHVRLGDQYLESGNVATANENYRKAVELDKDNADAAAKLAQTQATLAAAKQEQGQVNEAQVEEALVRSAALVAQKKFEEAAQLLKSLGMGYGTRKAADVRKAYADAYVAWAVDRLDRQDPAGAAEKLQFALRLDPTNQTARQLLIRAYEGDPTKLKEIAEFYADSSNPADQIKRADALFRLRQYEDALPIYLKHIADPALGNAIVRERVRLIFDTLHRRYADKGDFESALRWYTTFLQYSPQEDLTPLARYEFMIQRSKTDMNDPAARAALAEFAEQRGMTDTARTEFLNVLSIAPDQPQALAGVRRYAAADMEDARSFFAQGQYTLAAAKLTAVTTAYPMLSDIIQEAQALRGQVDVEAARVQQTRLQQAVALAERGDRYMEQAMSYMSALISTNVDPNVRIFSPRQEALKYLGWALFAWQNALQIDPSLGDPATHDLYRKIVDARGKFASLGSRITPPLPQLGPDRQVIIDNDVSPFGPRFFPF